MSNEVVAEIVAEVWRILVGGGDDIAEGDTICILESMKMEIPWRQRLRESYRG